MPNSYWNSRCARCDASLHSRRETVAVALALITVPLAAVLFLL
jgi:hypothetical protein